MLEIFVVAVPIVFGSLVGALLGSSAKPYVEEFEEFVDMFEKLKKVVVVSFGIANVISFLEFIILYMPMFRLIPLNELSSFINDVAWSLVGLVVLLLYNNILSIPSSMISYVATSLLNYARECVSNVL